jgi:plasmid stabilization system protein ParE
VSTGPIRFLPEASGELEEAFAWYLDRSPRAAEAFLHEWENALTLISSSPAVWPSFEAGTRRYVLRRFPFSVIYRETAGGLEIVALMHHKRRPGYWHER